MTILVTSLEPSTGKTAVTLAVAETLRERDETVGYMKPKGTRLESAVGKTLDEDPKLARELLGLDAELHELEPIVYSPTFVTEVVRGREDEEALREQLETQFESLAEETDRMLLEGGDTLSTGRSVNLSDIDIAELLDATVVLVASYTEPKDVDELLDAADRLGDRLGGILFNDVPDAAFDSLATDVVPFLESRGVRVYGTVPRDETLSGSSVSEIAAELGADVLTNNVPTDGLVQRFVVGATSAGEVLSELRRVRDAALVTGGDRTDVQTAALEASGVECLVLTGGFKPSSAVVGRAESADVPVLAVRTDTKTTLDRLEALVRSGRTRDAETVDRMQSLLADYADIDAMTEP
ncbi:DRTGG domain protein [Natronomonas pharaonis DSM 2160]|uniref:DRTGG domain protein n=1 Tax=Natronomonas pharaonis (strain ATCC 35678 / DSM 2160 / CIP 103997 / JCM 8858 / NBRC 14720 / NCIMB 2260 / Gabara) TaxID=348780 RepID=A0A1U7EWP7_NATPD|nr:phosphotransacetylase family protein [Natronomonas pharaonis]CAI49519.1 DRTGG domain protein [Natronomonas pharaonis DSM 2160]